MVLCGALFCVVRGTVWCCVVPGAMGAWCYICDAWWFVVLCGDWCCLVLGPAWFYVVRGSV